MCNSFRSKILMATVLLGAAFGGNLYAQAPIVVRSSLTPAPFSTGTSTTIISAQFNLPLNPATITPVNVRVYGEQSGLHNGILNYDLGSQTISFSAASPFQAGERVTVVFTNGITGSGGLPIAGFQWSFYIESLASTGAFDLDSTYSTADGPNFVSAGRFNADNAVDLAIPNSRGDDFASTWHNDGAGAFIAADAELVGNLPRSTAVADLDADGDLDLAVSNEESNIPGSISLLFNNGSGDFSGGASLLADGGTSHVTAGDLNGDGLIDLAATNADSNSISLYLNEGGGTFSDQVLIPVVGNPQSSFIADFNDDGFADLAVAKGDADSVTILLNDGAGGLVSSGSFQAGDTPRVVDGADFNGDGRVDLVVSNRGSANVSVLFNNGSGQFSPPNNYAVGDDPVGVAIGDWNGDGNPDLAAANRLSNDMYVLVNNGAGFFQLDDTYPLGAEPRGLAAGDFNGDGIVDLVAANFGDDTFQVFFNNFGAGLNNPPAAPTLATPADGSLLNPNTTPLQLIWNVPADADNNQLHFIVEIDVASDFAPASFTFDSRSDVTGFNPSPPVAQGTGLVTYSVATALPDGQYFWRVIAWDGLALSAPSQPRHFTVDATAPNIDRVVISDPDATPNWYNPNTTPSISFGLQYDELRAQRAEFNLGAALGGTVTLPTVPSGQDQLAQTTITFGQAADNSYPLTATIFDSAGNQGVSNTTIRLDRTPPIGTTASSPAVTSNTNFTVNWAGTGSDGAGSGLSGVYDIRVRTNSGPFTEWMSNFQGTSASFPGEDGNSYAFEVAAYDSVGNRELFTGNAETTTQVDVNANDTEAPGPPGNLTAAGANPSPWRNTPQFQVQWQEPSDPSGIVEAFYKLGAAPTSNNDFTDTLQGGTTTVQITATQQNGQNVFVWFSDGNGNVNFQNNASVALRFDNVPPTGAVARSQPTSANLDFTVRWDGSGSDGAGSGLSGFYHLRVRVNNGGFTDLETNFQGTSFVFNGDDGNTYSFEVAAYDVAGNREAFTGNAETTTIVDVNANDTDPPPAPTILTAAGASPSPWQSTPQFQIQWQEPNDPSGIERALYKLGAAPSSNFDTTASVRTGTAVTVTATQQDGQNLYLWFEDQNGNVDFNNNRSVLLRYDNTAPAVVDIEFENADFDTNWFNQSVTNEADVNITYSERHLQQIQLRVQAFGIDRNIQNPISGIGVSRQTSIDIEDEVDGVHTLRFTLTDSAGNTKLDSTRIALDSTAPTGTVADSPDTSGTNTFLVTWGSGSDANGSGLSGRYDLRFQVNGGEWQDWKTNFAGTSDNFTGEEDNEYGFEAAAYDNVGNREGFADLAETTTIVDPNFQDTAAPAIVHSPLTQVDQGNSATVTAQINDNIQVAEVRLFYQPNGQIGAQSLAMTPSGGNSYTATLTAQQVSTFGFQYSIRASDGTNFSFFPADPEIFQNVSVRITGTANQGLVKSSAQPSGGASTTYRMISVPLNLADSRPLAVLEDDLGEYDPNNWRLLQYNAATDLYREHPAVDPFAPGKAFWLIVRAANLTIDSGVGATVAGNQPFTINLVRGWNDIGVPFPFAIDASDILVTQGDTSDVQGPFTYQGDWRLPNQVTTMAPWEGYSFFCENPVTIAILPIASAAPPGQPLAKSVFDDEWHVTIEAAAGDLVERSNFIGVSQHARLQRDAMDYLQPPHISDYVAVTFPHHDWQGISASFTTDFRPLFDDGQVWSFEVASTLGREPIALRFGNLESIPAQFDAVVLDKRTLQQFNLRQNAQYVFTPEENETKREFELVIGTRDFVENSDVLNDAVPQTFFLGQNFPNPFNAGTTFTYRLAEQAHVSIKILNILGQQVRELVSQRLSPGLHRAHWDGLADNGAHTGSGVYLIQMEAGSFRQIRKMVLVR